MPGMMLSSVRLFLFEVYMNNENFMVYQKEDVLPYMQGLWREALQSIWVFQMKFLTASINLAPTAAERIASDGRINLAIKKAMAVRSATCAVMIPELVGS